MQKGDPSSFQPETFPNPLKTHSCTTNTSSSTEFPLTEMRTGFVFKIPCESGIRL